MFVDTEYNNCDRYSNVIKDLGEYDGEEYTYNTAQITY